MSARGEAFHHMGKLAEAQVSTVKIYSCYTYYYVNNYITKIFLFYFIIFTPLKWCFVMCGFSYVLIFPRTITRPHCELTPSMHMPGNGWDSYFSTVPVLSMHRRRQRITKMLLLVWGEKKINTRPYEHKQMGFIFLDRAQCA